VGNVITVQGVPERTYLERWGRELGIAKRLDELLASA
jgi:hypothetical protein